jgi:hypothetical protein
VGESKPGANLSAVGNALPGPNYTALSAAKADSNGATLISTPQETFPTTLGPTIAATHSHAALIADFAAAKEPQSTATLEAYFSTRV